MQTISPACRTTLFRQGQPVLQILAVTLLGVAGCQSVSFWPKVSFRPISQDPRMELVYRSHALNGPLFVANPAAIQLVSAEETSNPVSQATLADCWCLTEIVLSAPAANGDPESADLVLRLVSVTAPQLGDAARRSATLQAGMEYRLWARECRRALWKNTPMPTPETTTVLVEKRIRRSDFQALFQRLEQAGGMKQRERQESETTIAEAATLQLRRGRQSQSQSWPQDRELDELIQQLLADAQTAPDTQESLQPSDRQ